MIDIHISAENSSALRAQLASLFEAFVGPVAPAAMPTNDPAPEQPAKRTRAKKAETTEPVASEPNTPPPATDLFAATAAPAPEKQPEQKDLIAAFRALNDKKGTNAIVGLLTQYGAKTVALIPKDKWAEAIGAAEKLCA